MTWKRQPDGRYRAEHGEIIRTARGWEVHLSPDLVPDTEDREQVHASFRRAKGCADRTIRWWLDRRAGFVEIERCLMHNAAVMRRLEPIEYRKPA